ncbi:hypothetical protein OIM90_16625 [Streptomyces sp. AD16]|nr:hypothetical protein OIM90_16625 [Streptomyces sp. AD16]
MAVPGGGVPGVVCAGSAAVAPPAPASSTRSVRVPAGRASSPAASARTSFGAASFRMYAVRSAGWSGASGR